MKKTLIAITAVFAAVLMAIAAPTYEKGQYYVWDAADAAVATNALNTINASGWFPQSGSIPRFKTTSWCDEVYELKDGRFGFPRIPEATLDTIGVSQAERDGFWAAFNPSAVVVTGDMIKDEE